MSKKKKFKINPCEKLPTSIIYDGANSLEVMMFCGAYHINIGAIGLKLFIKNKLSDDSIEQTLLIKPGERLIKEEELFKVKE